MSKNKSLDELIRQAFYESMKKTPPPPRSAQDVWKKIQKEVAGENEKSKWNVLKYRVWITATSIFLLIGGLLLFSPQHGSAGKLTQFFYKIQGSVAHIFIDIGDSSGRSDAPSYDDVFTVVEGSEVTSYQMSLTEAQENTDFIIILPKYVPSGYVLKETTVLKNELGKAQEVYLHYERNGEEFTINEKKVGEVFGTGMVVDYEDTKVEQVMIKGQKATFLQYKNGVSQLIWTIPHFYLSIEGNLTKEELIRIAKSM